jgi:hypothetical protein
MRLVIAGHVNKLLQVCLCCGVRHVHGDVALYCYCCLIRVSALKDHGSRE